jgi:hypothetical protein
MPAAFGDSNSSMRGFRNDPDAATLGMCEALARTEVGESSSRTEQ